VFHVCDIVATTTVTSRIMHHNLLGLILCSSVV